MRLSVIVTCTQPWPEARACLDRLLPQARAGDIEVVVADGSEDGALSSGSEGSVRWLRFPERGPHELRLLGLTAVGGDVVAIIEDHCEVAPDWCEQVLKAHASRPDVAAVAGPVTNGATTRFMDRANFFLVHGQNLPEYAERPRDWFPPAGSNASYKRARVLPLVQQPGDLELVVVPQLWAQGSLVLDENIVVAHSQSLGFGEHVMNHFHSARSHAGLVAGRGAPQCRRKLARDAVSFPRIALRAALDVGREVPRRRPEIRRLLPAMAVLAVAGTAGYLAGLAGPGGSLRRLR